MSGSDGPQAQTSGPTGTTGQRPGTTGGRPGWLGTAVGALLVVAGVLWLLLSVLGAPASALWPLFVIVPGVVLLITGLALAHPVGHGLAVAGGVVSVVGALLAYQNLSGHWESWSYAWALAAPGGVGAGLGLRGRARGHPELGRTGVRLVLVGLLLAAVGFAVFEGIIGVSGRDFGRAGELALPIVLIVGGIVLLVVRPRR